MSDALTSVTVDEQEPTADEESIEKCLSDAEERKSDGNQHFRAKRWDEALVSYQSALGRLPKRLNTVQPITDPDTAVEEPIQQIPAEPEHKGHISTQSILEERCATIRSVLNANIGACFVKLNNHAECVVACTQALLDNPQYVKALQRRAASNEKINTWTALSSSEKDYTKLLTLLPPESSEAAEVNVQLKRLRPRAEEAQKKETAEMLSKLKGLGNSILGNFGLSTDNFKFEPNGNGGYGVNFSR